jgi:predicted HTH transcriptional regulator
LADLSYVRELNEGVPRIFNAMRQFMLAEPEYTDLANTVTLTLRNKVTDHKETIYSETFERVEAHWENLNKSQRQIIQLLLSHQEVNIPEMAKALQLTEHAIRYNLKRLEALEIIERLSDKPRDRHAPFRFKNK